MNIRPFEAILPKLDLIASPDVFFATVKQEYPHYSRSGFFIKDDDPSLFIHDIRRKDWRFTGVVGCVDLQAYLDGKILKHEKTLETKEQVSIELLLERRAMIKPVLLMYEPREEISTLLRRLMDNAPVFSVRFDQDEETHDLFKISKERDIAALQEIFHQHIHKAYIADGHHRCAINARLHQTNESPGEPLALDQILAVFLPMDQMIVHDYNRVIEILHEISPTVFLAKMAALCDIEHLQTPAKPMAKHVITLYLDGEWYRLKWKRHILEKYKNEIVVLDGAILNEEVLAHILGITDVRNDIRLSYVQGISGIEGVIEKTRKSAYRIGFCIYPVSFSELVKVADAGKTLPPKSTWFEPRVKNGLIVKSL